jgi:hypothetical protein
MTPIEAKKIIENYHLSIKDLRPNAIVQSNKELPYTAARIKYAHFVYGEEIVKGAKIAEKIVSKITESYGLIDSLFSEDSEQINARYREYLQELRDGKITEFRMPNPFGEIEPVNEFHNFLDESWFFEYRTNLFNASNPLGAFIYDAVRNKAIKEKAITTLINFVNSSLTRAVHYPEKKSNAECVFIHL